MIDIEIILAAICAHDPARTREEHLGRVADPQFDNAGEFMDWRNHVVARVRENWAELSQESRLVCYLIALCEAKDEDF